MRLNTVTLILIQFITACDFDIEFIDKKSEKHYTIEELSREMDF